MKKIKYLFILLFISTFVGCSDDFVDVLPYGKAIPKSVDDLALLMNNPDAMSSFCWNYNSMIDDVDFIKQESDNQAHSPYNSFIWTDYIVDPNSDDRDWNIAYECISLANYVINNIETAEQGVKNEKEEVMAKAHFFRANAYFVLVNIYAKHYNASTAETDLGVPLMLNYDINGQEPRSSVQKVYDLIISDLEASLLGLKDYSKSDSPSLVAAYSLLGRVYLYQGNYTKSAEFSKKAIDVKSDFIDFNSIVLFDPTNPAVGNSYPSNTYLDPSIIFHCAAGLYSSPTVSKDLVALFDKTTDLRYMKFMSNKEINGSPVKEGFHRSTGHRVGYDMHTEVPEVLLNYCEALMKQTTPDKKETAKYLNMLRKNRFLPGYVEFTESTPNLLEEVLLERRKELRFTAWRWFDMKRFGVTVSRTYKDKVYTLKPTSPNYVRAIPENIRSYNSLLEQNPRGL